jgi:uncharacterized protein YndB with AHSA1/START domain
MDESLDPIIIQVTIPLPVEMIFAAFTDPGKISPWLGAHAEVEPHVGGTYRLSFQDDPPFTSEGVVTHYTPSVDIGFTWQSPPAFASLMNRPGSLTQVYVRFQESPEGIDVTLEHAGWESGEAWEEARSWHFHRWDERLSRLKEYLLRAAYG